MARKVTEGKCPSCGDWVRLAKGQIRKGVDEIGHHTITRSRYGDDRVTCPGAYQVAKKVR